MKKTLIAMAAVAVAGVASAQVTITGAMGFGIQDSSDQARELSWTDGKVTFAASEDLGGGMSISGSSTLAFADHSGTATGDGSSLSLAGGFGKLTYATVGADADKLGVASLPYSTNTVFGGTTDNYAYAQFDLPTLVDGLTAGVRWAGAAGDVNVTNIVEQYRLSYKAGPATIAFNTKTGSAEVQATYDFGIAKVSMFTDTKRAEAADATMKRREFSVAVPVSSALTLSASMASRPDFTAGQPKDTGTEYNATYVMSKRTSLSVNYGSFKTQGTVKTANRIKLVHAF
jgi:D-Tyr-tRNAtyr deacylase